ncbi:GNAT superfamily N-acetyltransferase [Sagittula marina]|uniref:GNAT superfamily N-acetyltransferase n=1 Tax=Sagittula marina TaxID=943940 RepID=A0A7W6DWK7_9RHOB|nr:GNAT family N-acetyltransferase [Sagittula marina]MBB3988302.1 GNAT superfamily N-acetyltransferase [Sagittula marina]
MNDSFRFDAYEAQVEPIKSSDLGRLHELTISVFWPHRDSDLDMLMKLGHGYIAVDEIGRPLGSAMHFPMGDDFAVLGMMVTPPRLQAQGGGRFLLKRIMADCEGRDLRLNATRSGYRLYQSVGFQHVKTVFQHQGIVSAPPAVDSIDGIELSPITMDDRPAVKMMDQIAFGADRPAVIDALLDISTGVVASRAGKPCGIALMRRFGKGYVIGPLIAESETLAVQMVADLLRQVPGHFVRLDTPCDGPLLTGFLTASGMTRHDQVTEMRIGGHMRPEEGLVMYGLAAHSLG